MRRPANVIDIETRRSILEAEDADRFLNPDLSGLDLFHQVGSWDLHTGDARRDGGE